MAIAWANDVWNDQSTGVNVMASQSQGRIDTAEWNILWVPSMKPLVKVIPKNFLDRIGLSLFGLN